MYLMGLDAAGETVFTIKEISMAIQFQKLIPKLIG